MPENPAKLKIFLFVSLIALLINLAVCVVAYAESIQDVETYTIIENNEIKTVTSNITTSEVGVNNFAVATATSFLPFVDFVNIVFLLPNLDPIVLIFTSLLITIFGAIKLIIIVWIVTDFIPFIDV